MMRYFTLTGLFVFIFHFVVLGQKPVTTLKLSEPLATNEIHLGSAFMLTYELESYDGNIGDEVSFVLDREKFGYPLLMEVSHVGHRTYRGDSEEERAVALCRTFIYAFVPVDTGVIVVPRAFVEINGKRYDAEEQMIRVLPPKKEPIRDLKVYTEIIGELMEREVFTLKVTIEGDCDEAEDFRVYAPAYPWWTPVNNFSRRHYMPHVDKVTKSAGKQVYEMLMKAEHAGSHQLSDLFVWGQKDGIHYLSDPVGAVTIKENPRDPRQIAVMPILPDTVWQGKPFTMRYKVEGCFGAVDGSQYETTELEGWDVLQHPLLRYMDHYGYQGPDDPLYEEYGNRVTVYDLVTELRAHTAGTFTLPELKVVIDRDVYTADPVTLEVVPCRDLQPASLKVETSVQMLAVQEEEFWFTNLIEGYSGDLLSLEVDLKAYEKELVRDFIIIGKDMKINERDVERGLNSSMVKSFSQYKWLLQARKPGMLTIPVFKVGFGGIELAGEEKVIDVREQQTSEFVEVTVDSVGVQYETVKMNIAMKEKFWEIKEVVSPELTVWKEIDSDLSTKPKNKSVWDDVVLDQRYKSETKIELTPVESGILEIPPFLVRTDLGEFYTDPVRIEVLPADTQANVSTPDSIHPADAYVEVVLSKNKVYPNEPVFMTDYLYSTLWMKEVTGYDIVDRGDFDFDNQLFNVGKQSWEEAKTKELKRVKNRNYEVRPLRRWVLYPVNEGLNRLPDTQYKVNFTLNKRKLTRNTFFEDVPRDQVDVKWRFATCIYPELEVIPFPEQGKPAGFEGFVGDFTIESSVEESTGDDGRPEMHLIVDISGVGSFPLLIGYQPLIHGLADAVALTELTNHSSIKGVASKGLACELRVVYRIETTTPGSYEIPAIPFYSFDPDSLQYKTVSTQAISFKTE